MKITYVLTVYGLKFKESIVFGDLCVLFSKKKMSTGGSENMFGDLKLLD